MSQRREERLRRLQQTILYGIVDLGYVEPEEVAQVTQRMIDQRVGVIQLRAKNLDQAEVLKLAQVMSPLIAQSQSLFVVNDYPEIAMEVKADGLHVGQDDGAYELVKKLVDPEMFIGRSTHSIEQAKQAYQEGFDYIGFGPLFVTATKPGRLAIGLEEIQLHQDVMEDFPVFCIGGVNLERLPAIRQAGAKRYVIVSELLNHVDSEEYWDALGALNFS